jgi:hypothetical protein
MMPRTGPRRDRVKKQGIVWLAGAAMWIAIGAAPRLAVMLWARVVLRWARPGPRRPG